MTYRTRRPRARSLLTFGVGATLAITQLGAGCVPADGIRLCTTADAASGGAEDDSGDCVSDAGPLADAGPDGSDAR
jgi:hypothetical protein